MLGLVAWAIIWILVAFWPARVASRKGYSFIGFFIFSIFLFPVALLVAYMVHDRYAVEHQRQREKEKEIEASLPEL